MEHHPKLIMVRKRLTSQLPSQHFQVYSQHFSLSSFSLLQKNAIHLSKGMTASLPLISITPETCSQTQPCHGDLALAIDSFPRAYHSYQVLPHNWKEAPEDPNNSSLVLASIPTCWTFFSALRLCEVFLKHHYCSLLSPPSRVQVPRGPTWLMTSLCREKLLFSPRLDFYCLT